MDFEESMAIARKQRKNRRICGKRIILVEGPAGAGKSSLLDRLAEIPEVCVVSRSLQKRTLQIGEAGTKSFLNDNIKMMDALIAPQPVVFIDRCIASQKVYHAIRTDRPVKNPDNIWLIPILQLESLEADLAWRLDRSVRTIEVYWLFLIPSVNAITHRRKTGGKDYPNNAFEEVVRYKEVSNNLLLNSKEILRPSYENMEDQDFLVRGFTKWLEYLPYLTFPELWRTFTTLEREEK